MDQEADIEAGQLSHSRVTDKEKIKCFIRLQYLLRPDSEDEDVSDEDEESGEDEESDEDEESGEDEEQSDEHKLYETNAERQIKRARHDRTFKRLMREKESDPNWRSTVLTTVWEVMADLLFVWFLEEALVTVLGSYSYSYESKFSLACCLLRRPKDDVDRLALTDSDGRTALHLAIICKYDASKEEVARHDIVKLILSKCQKLVNRKDKSGDTPLLMASRILEEPKVLKKMVKRYGADVHVVNNDGENVLHILAANRECLDSENSKMVKYFCSRGVSVNAKNNDGCGPLHATAETGSVESVKYLLAKLKGADIDAINPQKCTALHIAASRQLPESKAIVSLLIKKGADLGLRDLEDCSPLDLAVEMKCQVLFDLLRIKSSSKDGTHEKNLRKLWSESNVQDKLLASEIHQMSHFGVVEMISRSIPRRKKQKRSHEGKQASTEDFDFFEMLDKSKTFKESTRTMLDQFVLGGKIVSCGIFDADSKGNFPDHEKFNPRTAPLLAAIVETNSTDLALHPVVKAVVDHKWNTVFGALFRLHFLFYLLRTLLFTLALLIAARPDLDNPGCYKDWDFVRLFVVEVPTCVLFLVDIAYICIEFIWFVYSKYYTKRWKIRNKAAPDPEKESIPFRYRWPVYSSRILIKLETLYALIKGHLLRVLAVVLPFGIIPFRVATTWCASTGEGYCALPVINSTTGNYSTDINVPCTVASHVQWIFAAVAYLVNGFLILEFLALFKPTGVYVRILINVVKSDILKFSILYLVFLVFFMCSFYFFLRGGVVITSDGQLISDVKLFAPNVPYPFSILLFGVRMLMESGGISSGYFAADANIMYNNYQWFLVCIYATFLLFMSVVLLSLLIAQLNHSYSQVQEDAKGTFALARARVVVRLQKQWFFCKKFLSKLGIKKKFYKDLIWIVPRDQETNPWEMHA